MFKMHCFNGIQTINNSYTQSCSKSEFLKIRRKEIGLNIHEKNRFHQNCVIKYNVQTQVFPPKYDKCSTVFTSHNSRQNLEIWIS